MEIPEAVEEIQEYFTQVDINDRKMAAIE